MTLRGTAFLPIWHDIDAGIEAEFDLWHTAEHMPERVYTPGIVVGRRYENAAAGKHRYFVLYEAMSFEVFASEGYFVTANDRSEWTRRIHPHFRNFMRAPCHLVMTRGRGIGGALATARVRFPASAGPDISAKDAFALCVRALVDGIMDIPLVTAVHVGVTAPVSRAPLSSNSLSLRPNATAFDGVILVESIGRQALQNLLPRVGALLQAQSACIASFETGIYELSQLITAGDAGG